MPAFSELPGGQPVSLAAPLHFQAAFPEFPELPAAYLVFLAVRPGFPAPIPEFQECPGEHQAFLGEPLAFLLVLVACQAIPVFR